MNRWLNTPERVEAYLSARRALGYAFGKIRSLLPGDGAKRGAERGGRSSRRELSTTPRLDTVAA